jgi:hypothetical protein
MGNTIGACSDFQKSLELGNIDMKELIKGYCKN